MQQNRGINLVGCAAVGVSFLVGFQLISCMPVMMMIYGIHQPRYVSDAAVIKYHEGLGLQGEIYRLKDYNESNGNRFRYVGNAMPDMLLFNSKGQMTSFDTDCSSDFVSMTRLSPEAIDSLKVVDKKLVEFISDTYRINDFGKGELKNDQRPVYVVKFAEFAGKLNKENVPDLVEKLREREDVQLIVLNMDYSVAK